MCLFLRFRYVHFRGRIEYRRRHMKKPFNVALIVPPSHFSAAAIVRGAGRFAAERPHWRVTIASASDLLYLKQLFKQCDGIIGNVCDELLPLLNWTRTPAVAYFDAIKGRRYPVVVPDEQRIGEIGAEHLLERGYERFGFFGMPTRWSQGRETGFVRRLAGAGFTCHTTAVGEPPGRPPTWEELGRRSFLPRWMKRIVPPAAVMAANDWLARDVIDACDRLGWRIPEDIAVLGVDNDELVCTQATIGLSSIDRNLERIGFEAARLLERLIVGEASRNEMVVVPPGPLVTRQSTEVCAGSDPDATTAARYIREHGCGEIDVSDVLAVVPISRRALERKLRKLVGRTPAQEIRRVRLARACQLLTDTDLAVSDIAGQCGFQYRTYLARTFKKVFGETPRQYRKRTRGN
jgi:LacI family transcriptional regulator